LAYTERSYRKTEQDLTDKLVLWKRGEGVAIQNILGLIPLMMVQMIQAQGYQISFFALVSKRLNILLYLWEAIKKWQPCKTLQKPFHNVRLQAV